MRFYSFDSKTFRMTRLPYTADIPLGLISVEDSGRFTPDDKFLVFEVQSDSTNIKYIARVDLENQNIYFLNQTNSTGN